MELSGSLCALVTPFTDGKVDIQALEGLVDFQITNGTSGLIPCGTTGESATLSHAEHHEVIATTVRAAKKRVPVIAGTGSNSTSEALSLTRKAKDLGADAALVITPYYNKPTQEGLYQHYMAIADAVDLPIVLYNVPGRTAVSISPETVARLSAHTNIVAIKEASGSLDYVSQLRQLSDITVLSGNDSLNLPLISLGAKGAISVTANVAPKPCAELIACALKGDWAKALAVHDELYPLTETLFIETNPIPVKEAVAMLDLVGREIRMPLTQASEKTVARLRSVMKKLDLI